MSIITRKFIDALIPESNIIDKNSSTFESSIGSWVTYADAAAAQPVDGTGGSPSVTISRTVVTAEVLNGSASLKFSKDAANRQGQGASLTFDVPNYLKGLPCQIKFAAKASANFDFGTAFNSADPSDVTVYLYDVTNSKLLQPYPYTIDSNLGYEGYAQIPSNCSSLRLILHVTTTNAAAYDLFIDDVEITAAPNQNVSADSDWQSYTPTFQGLGTVTLTESFWLKRGDSLYIRGRGTLGTTTAATARITLPEGLVISNTKTTTQTIVEGKVVNNSTSGNFCTLIALNDTAVLIGSVSGSTGLSSTLGSTFGSSGQAFAWAAGPIPIQGWTSGQVTAASANLNAPVVFYGTQTSQAVTGTVTDITFTAQKDTVGAWSTNQYVVKVPGDYLVCSNLTCSSAATGAIYKNGVRASFTSFASVSTATASGSIILTNLVVGDIISTRAETSTTVTNSNFTISRLVNSNAVYATRTAYLKDVKASGTAGGTFTSGSYQTRVLNTIEGDSSFVSLSSNQFTLQPGTYEIEASAPAYRVNGHKLKLRNITGSSDTIIGGAAETDSSNFVQTESRLVGTISISSTTTYEIQHRCGATFASSGFGRAAAYGDSEVYTIVKIKKVL